MRMQSVETNLLRIFGLTSNAVHSSSEHSLTNMCFFLGKRKCHHRVSTCTISLCVSTKFVTIIRMECLKEIQQFLKIETPQHLKAIAVTNVLSMLPK